METRSFDLRRHREMRAFWTTLSQARVAREGIDLPSFADFELMDLPLHLIRGAVLIDLGLTNPRAGAEGRPFYRFAGETHYNMLGFECTRHYLDDLPFGALSDHWTAVLAELGALKAPMNGEIPHRDAMGREMVIHWLRLPLSRNGRDVDMVLGHDVYEGPGSPLSQTHARVPIGQ